MSKRGALLPELAALLNEIASRLENNANEINDAEILRRLAKSADGSDPHWQLRVHQRPGRGRNTPQVKLSRAKAIAEYRAAHGCTLPEAFAATCGRFHVSAATMGNAWREMRDILQAGDEAQRTLLYFMELEARGRATITKRGKK